MGEANISEAVPIIAVSGDNKDWQDHLKCMYISCYVYNAP